MADQSMLDSSSTSTTTGPTNPQENALQSLCKHLLKSRFFRGFYVERRYVENVKGYRDIVCLHQSEKKLDKLLRDIQDKLQLFYNHQNTQMWIGITSGFLPSLNTKRADALETYLWVEIKDLAFDLYCFSIKSIRFRDNEIILKLKEEKEIPRLIPSAGSNIAIFDKTNSSTTVSSLAAPPTTVDALENQVNLDDFILLLLQWWASIKKTVYDFMAKDISKENIKELLRFLCLLFISVLSGALVGIKFLGVFTIRLIFELSRLTHVLTPIILKIIEVFNKMIGGFYILLAMMWKDAVVNRNQPKHNAVQYNPIMYKSTQYEVRQRRLEPSSAANFGNTFQ